VSDATLQIKEVDFNISLLNVLIVLIFVTCSYSCMSILDSEVVVLVVGTDGSYDGFMRGCLMCDERLQPA